MGTLSAHVIDSTPVSKQNDQYWAMSTHVQYSIPECSLISTLVAGGISDTSLQVYATASDYLQEGGHICLVIYNWGLSRGRSLLLGEYSRGSGQ